MPDEHLPIFVYGTLMRGEEREPFWPHPPTQIELATARGRLHDLGPYPAMVEGQDLIGGELWTIAAEHLPQTLTALDQVEDFAQGGVDLYKRTIINCQTAEDRQQRAFAYLYGSVKAIASTRVIEPDEDGICRWRRGK